MGLQLRPQLMKRFLRVPAMERTLKTTITAFPFRLLPKAAFRLILEMTAITTTMASLSPSLQKAAFRLILGILPLRSPRFRSSLLFLPAPAVLLQPITAR